MYMLELTTFNARIVVANALGLDPEAGSQNKTLFPNRQT
jgi:hypothetical protein